MKIIWSPLAIERVSEIAEYIALDNPVAAEKWVDDIFGSSLFQVGSSNSSFAPIR